MITALLLATAPIVTAVDAERAFAADAKRIGQWSAFRKWADRDAVIFTPQAAWAQTALPKANPPKAISWQPAQSFVSCNGRIAVNTGPWWKSDGTPGGYFTTVWQRGRQGWRWVYDGGGPLANGVAIPSVARVRIQQAACRGRPTNAPINPPPPLTPKESRKTPIDNGRGQSADRTLGWDWKVDKQGARTFRVFLWTGKSYAQVLHNDVPPPQ